MKLLACLMVLQMVLIVHIQNVSAETSLQMSPLHYALDAILLRGLLGSLLTILFLHRPIDWLLHFLLA